MKKTLSLGLLALFLAVGCSSVKTLPNIYDQGETAYADDTEALASPYIYEGITVGGVDVSGTNLESIKDVLEEELGSNLDRKIQVKYKDNNKEVTLRDLGYYYDYDDLGKQALKIGREGSEEERLALIKSLKDEPVDIKADLKLKEGNIEKLAKDLASEVDVKPEEAVYSYNAETDSIDATDGVDGYKLEEEKLIEDIKSAALEGKDGVEAEISVVNTGEDAKEKAASVNGIIGAAESTFNNGFWVRAENIRVSTRALNGFVVAPGEVWSFNDFLGDTTREKGYQEAVVINENNEEVPGMGGGVCQTSTCLYQALLKAEVNILNRVPHTQLMSYSQPGLDAAVEYGSADLAFRNNYDFPILIKSYVDGGWLRFEIWGDTNTKDFQVTLFSEEINNYHNDGGRMFSSYRRNEATGEVEYIGDSYYPPL